MRSFLYRLVFPNGKSYVGITANIAQRMKGHRDSSRAPKVPVHKAIMAFGWAAVRVETLAIGPRGYIAAAEQKAIEVFGSHIDANGYNVSPGGEISPMLIPGVAARAGVARRGRKASDKAIENMRAAHLGKKHSPETKLKMSIAQSGRVISDEARLKIGAAHKGWIASPETRLKMSIAARGRKREPAAVAQGAVAWAITTDTPEFRAKRSLISKAIHTPEMRVRKGASVHAAFQDPEVQARHRAAYSVGQRRRWERHRQSQIQAAGG